MEKEAEKLLDKYLPKMQRDPVGVVMDLVGYFYPNEE